MVREEQNRTHFSSDFGLLVALLQAAEDLHVTDGSVALGGSRPGFEDATLLVTTPDEEEVANPRTVGTNT